MTGVMLRRMHSRNGSVFTAVTSPTNPMSSSSPDGAVRNSFRQAKISLPENPRALPPRPLMVLTIAGLTSRDNTCSTTLTVASSVTRMPWTKCDLIPAASIARVMALPPP